MLAKPGLTTGREIFKILLKEVSDINVIHTNTRVSLRNNKVFPFP